MAFVVQYVHVFETVAGEYRLDYLCRCLEIREREGEGILDEVAILLT